MNAESVCIDRLVNDETSDTDVVYDLCENSGFNPVYYSFKHHYLVGYKTNESHTTVCFFMRGMRPTILDEYPKGPLNVNEAIFGNMTFVISNNGNLDFYRIIHNTIIKQPY